MRWCEVEFFLSRRQDDGSTLRDNLSAAERVGARPHPLMVAAAETPDALLYLFEIFAELNGVRRVGFTGVEPLGFDQIHYWQQATGMKLRAWERRLLLRVDMLWRVMQDKKYPGPKLGEDHGD